METSINMMRLYKELIDRLGREVKAITKLIQENTNTKKEIKEKAIKIRYTTEQINSKKVKN